MSPGPRCSPAVLPPATARTYPGVGAPYKIHCPKCRMSFDRGVKATQKRVGCPDCGVTFGDTEYGPVSVSVDPTAARQAWGLE